MPTQEQDVTVEKAKLSEFKADLMSSIADLLALPRGHSEARDNALLRCQRLGNAYFNHAEEFVGNSSLLGAHGDALWVQGFAEDCAEILNSMPSFYDLLKTGFESSAQLSQLQWRPGTTAFANMQRMVALYLDDAKVAEISASFKEHSLPTYGFQKKAKSLMQRDKLLSFIFGSFFVVVLLVIAFVKPDPSEFQYSVFRTVLALAGAGIGAVIPGSLQVNVSKWIRAGGAIAVFVIVYFWVPAQLVKP